MAASLLKLLAGVVESFVGKKPPTEIAKILGVEYPEFRVALKQTIHHTWRGKLTFVLADPQFRPDLVPYYTHLARLEEQYGVLMNQCRRAELICLDYRAHPHPVALHVLLKAETFANRVQSQCVRILRDIQKTELLLAKAEKNPQGAEELPQKEAKAANKPAAEAAPQPEPNSEDAAQPAPVKSSNSAVAIADSVGSALRTEETLPLSPPATNNQPVATDFPTPEAFKLLIFKHRHRIKDTPAKDRPELIARLIEQDRMRKHEQPDPHQNGKQAA